MTTITIQILTPNGHSAPGKLADAEVHFTGGELDGLKLVGFAIWQGRDGHGQNVSSPSTASVAASLYCDGSPSATRRTDLPSLSSKLTATNRAGAATPIEVWITAGR